MNFDSLLNQFNFLVIFQGFFLALALLFLKKGDSVLNKMLGLMLFTFSWSGLYFTIDGMGEMKNYLNLAYTNAISDYIYNPLLFLYVVRLTSKAYKITYRSLLHFIPTALLFFYYANYYFAPASVKAVIFTRGYNYFPYDVAVFAYVNLLQLIIYLTMSAIVLNRYAKQINQVYSNTARRNHNWLKFILIINCTAAVVCFFMFGTSYAGVGKLISFLSATLVYAIGYKMMSAPPHLPELEMEEIISPVKGPETAETETSNIKYERSGLSNERLQQLASKLTEFILTKNPWLDPELNLKQLAEALNCQPHHLSQVINQHFGKNFYDYINAFRVDEVKARLTDEKYNHLTLLAIAFDCGFNSQASFNNVFKKFTGVSPSDYKKETAQHKKAEIV